MRMVEAGGEVESDVDEGALDMAAVTFIERQAPSQPPRGLKESPKSGLKRYQTLSPKACMGGRWRRYRRERGFPRARSAPNT
jgi:hypothetical protein